MFMKYDKIYEVKNRNYHYYSFVNRNKINKFINDPMKKSDYYFFPSKLETKIFNDNIFITFGCSTVVYKSTYKEKINSRGIFPYFGKISNPEILVYNLQDKEKCEKLLYRFNNYIDFYILEKEIEQIEEMKYLNDRLNSVI